MIVKTKTKNDVRRLNNIQALRAYAALSVVFLHVFEMLHEYSSPTFLYDTFGKFGMSGVDVFFVISGFIMVYIQGDRSPDIVRFLKDRLFRIISIYWPLSLFMLVMAQWDNMAPERTIEHVFASLLFLSQTLSEYLGEDFPVLGLGWTLEFEVLFYVVFSLALFCRNINMSVIFTSLALLSVVLVFGKAFLLIEFIFGMLVGLLYRKIRLSWVIGFAIMLFGFVLLFSTIPTVFSGVERVVFWGGPATLIVFGALYAPQIRNRVIILIGDASYSIYLTHFIAMTFFYRLMYDYIILNKWSGMMGLFCLVSVTSVGIAFYLLFERPVMRWYKRRK